MLDAPRHAYLTLTVGYVLLVVLATAVCWVLAPRDLGSTVTTAAGWAIAYGLLALFETRRRRKTKAWLDEHGQIMAYIRYPDSPAGATKV